MCVCVCPLGASAQNDLNLYQDFTGDSASLFDDVGANCSAALDGEYQWYWDERPASIPFWFTDTLPWSGLYRSWRIEAVSFPFVTDKPRTLAADSVTRLLTAVFDTLNYPLTRTGNLNGQQLGPPASYAVDINEPLTLASNSFTSNAPASFGTKFLPHTILRHTLYIHATDHPNSRKVDSIAFIVDLTRGGMRRYPFRDVNFEGSGGAGVHDVAIRMEVILPDSLEAAGNALNTLNYFPGSVDFTPLTDEFEDVYCNIPSPHCDYSSNEPVDYARPSDYSYLRIRLQMQEGCRLPAGFQEDTVDPDLLIKTQGILHHYFVEENLDLTKINSTERKIYNPSQVYIEADSLVFPSGYTFQTVRGVYATEAEVDTSSWCEPEGVPAQSVIVPTDLELSQYILRSGSRVFVQPCVYLYDLVIRVDSGAVFSFYPEGTYGNYMLVNNGGTIDSLSYNGLCNNCRCVQEYTVANNYNVTDNTTVNYDATVNGLIRVKPGNVLNIRNCTVRFSDSDRVGKRSGIVVEPGGKLLLDNALLTSLDCDRLWDGVEVEGDPDIVSPLATTDNQGGVRMINGATISRSRVGLYAGGFCPDGMFCPEDVTYAGGYVEIDSAHFLNNRIDIKFAAYNGPHLGYIRNATFATTIKEKYLFEGDVQIEHVVADNRSGVRIAQSTFSNELYDQYPDYRRGTGITAINSSITADSCAFSGLTRTADVYTFSGLNRRLHFTNNTIAETYFPVTVRGGRLDRVVGNTFSVPTLQYIDEDIPPMYSPLVIDSNYAVYLLGSQMFRVADNKFLSDSMSADNYPYAMAMRNSGLGGGSSFFNRLQGYAIGIQTEGDNRHVLLRCDTLESQRNTDYRLNPLHEEALLLDTLADFGSACLQGGTANNIFLGSSYNISKEVVNPVYYASGQPGLTYSESSKHNLGSDFVECEMDEADLLSCPSLLDCWLVDCEGMATVILDTLIETTDTIIFSPLRMHAYQELLSYALDQLDSLEFAEAILEAEGSLWAKRLLLPHYLETGQLSAAAQMLSDLDVYQGHPYDEAENAQYYKLYGAVYTTYAAGKTLQEMTATQRNKVEQVAQTPYGVGFAAQAIQAHNMGKRFHRIPDSSPSPQPKLLNSIAQNFGVRVYPNPTSRSLNVSASEVIHRIILYDLMGRVVEFWEPRKGQVIVDLPYPSGLYLLEVSYGKGLIELHRIFLAH